MFVRFVKVIDGICLIISALVLIPLHPDDANIVFYYIVPYLVFKAALYIILDISFLPWRY